MGRNVTIGHCTCLGFPEDGEDDCLIGDNVKIGCFCVISIGSTMGNNVQIDHYCRVGRGSKIGEGTKLLYGARIHEDVVIGKNCIIGGNCPNGVVIEDKVTHMGRIVHNYSNPNLDWDLTEEPSPRICSGAVIGANALIIGGITIGSGSYIVAGEIVRHDVPPNVVLSKGKSYSQSEWKGKIQLRSL